MTLQIRLLGQFELAHDGELLPRPATTQACSLLSFLVSCLAQAHPREYLADLFWPERPRDKALRSLSTALWHIRRVLPPGDYILSDTRTVQFDPHSHHWLDVAEFKRLITTQSTISHLESAIANLHSALSLYRGPFLEGFYDDWCLEERYYLEGIYLSALEQLIDMHQALDQPQPALEVAQQLLARDPLREDVHNTVVQLHLCLGDQAQAFRQARRCCALLRAELDVDPTQATMAAWDELLGPAWRSAAAVPTPQRVRVPGRTALLLQVPPFVGREAELDALLAHWDRARRGRGGLVLVSGEAGIGKSRLADELDQRVRQYGGWVAAARCYEQEHALPHGPLTDLLRAVLKVAAPTLQDRLAPWQTVELSRLAPELSERPPSPAQEVDQARLFDALARLFLDAARQNALLLQLDNLHWAPDSTLTCIHYLTRRLSDAPLLLVGTYRLDEIGPAHPLHRLAAFLDCDARLELPRLKRDALASWLEESDVAAMVPGMSLADLLHDRTDGNPFFALETLRALAEQDHIRFVDGHWVTDSVVDVADLPIPSSVRQVIQMRLARLSPEAQSVAEVAAVIGRGFDMDVLVGAWGRGEDATLDALDELLRRHLVWEGQSSTDRDYEFDHHLVQEVLYRGLHHRRRQRLHRQVGRTLERALSDHPELVGDVARHYDAGGEAARALPYHHLAAVRVAAAFDWQRAEAHQTRALALLEQLDPERVHAEYLTQRGRVLSDRAHQYYLQGQLAERDADLAALVELADMSGDERLHLQVTLHQARYRNLDGHYQKAIVAARDGLALAERLDDRAARSRLLAQIGFAHYFLGQPQPALAALESARELVDADDNVARGRIAHIMGYVHFHLGDYGRALACQQEAYECHRAAGDDNRVAWDGLDIGAAYLETGRLDEARRYLDEGLALARRIGAQPAEAYGLTLTGCWELHRGSYATAADRFQAAFSLQRELSSEHGCVAAGLGVGLALYHLGDLDPARRWLERAVAQARSLAHRRRWAEALVGLGLVEIAAGRFDIACAGLSEAVDLSRESECCEGLSTGLAALARAERGRGAPAAALCHAAEAVQIARQSDLPTCIVWAELECGLAQLDLAETEPALNHIERAVALLPQAHQGWVSAKEINQAHARALRAASHPA